MVPLRRKIKYPKLILLVITIILAYIVFYERNVTIFHDILRSLGYLGPFVSGIFFSYGFTAVPATAFLMIFAHDQNIIIAALIGGCGAVIGDYIIFKLIKHSFQDEIKKLSDEKILELAQICQKIEKHYNFPCDIEFAIENGKIYIVQSRPITTL